MAPKDEIEYLVCGDCKWWCGGSLWRDGKAHNPFSCRRNPPVVVMSPSGYSQTTWPLTDGGDWCGEFTKRSD